LVLSNYNWSFLNQAWPNLNAGNGNPCAGQVRATDDPDIRSYVADFVSLVNFGLALPIGSVYEKQ